MTIEDIYNTLYESIPIELKKIANLVEKNRSTIYNLLVKNRDFTYHRKNENLPDSLKCIFQANNLLLSIESQCVSLYFYHNKIQFHIDLNNSQSFFLLKDTVGDTLVEMSTYSTILTKDRMSLQEYYGSHNSDNIRFNIKTYPNIIDNVTRGTAAYVQNLNEIFDLINSNNYSDTEIKDFLSLKSDYSDKSKESYFINHQLVINNLLKKEYKNQNKLKK